MVEALVAIPFFITIFTSILYIGHLYGEKERTMYRAKQGAWAYALNSCEGNELGAQLGADLADAATQLGQKLSDQNASLAGQALDNQGGNLDTYANLAGGAGTKLWGTAVYTSVATVAAAKWLGGFHNLLITTTKVQCNEKREDGSIKGVLDYGWGLIHF